MEGSVFCPLGSGLDLGRRGGLSDGDSKRKQPRAETSALVKDPQVVKLIWMAYLVAQL